MNNKTLCPFALALPFAARTAVLSRGDRRRAPSAGSTHRAWPTTPAAAGGGPAAAVADLGAVLEAQRLRTPEQVRWRAPTTRTAFAGDLLGASFDKERLPLTRSFSTAPRKTWSRC